MRARRNVFAGIKLAIADVIVAVEFLNPIIQVICIAVTLQLSHQLNHINYNLINHHLCNNLI